MQAPDRPPVSSLVSLRTALFLDFDGTLADLADRPEGVTVAPGLVATLARLRDLLGGAVAVVSGRPLAQLDAFLAPLELPSSGVHGAERRSADGTLHHVESSISPDVIASLQAIADAHAGVLVEAKPGAVAMHYRLAPHLEAMCIGAMQRAASYTPGCALLIGKMVAELKPASVSKGTAIDAYLGELPFEGRHPVFAGDDTTDEAGFAVVQSRGGIGIKVGPGASIAATRLPSPAALREWLGALCEQLGSAVRLPVASPVVR
jgi:trehalose 6-phosphate phosphatase